MSILQKPPKKDPFLGNMNTFVPKSPVDDFLSGFKAHNVELEQKISDISGRNNGPAPVFTMPAYNPIVDKIKGIGDISTGQGVTVNTPIVSPVSMPEDPTQGGLYKKLAPLENFATAGQEITRDFSKNLQIVGKDIMSTSNELGNMIQNKAPGMEQAKAEGRYLSEKEVKAFIEENKGMSEDDIVSAMAELEKEGYFFEGYNDVSNPDRPDSLTADIIGAGVKGIGGIFGAGAQALGGTMEGTQNIAEGDTALGASQIVKQVPNTIIAGTSAVFPLASTIGGTALSTDTGHNVMTPVMNVSGKVTNAGLNLTLPENTRPEIRDNLQEGFTGLLPIVATAGAGKGLRESAPYIKEGAKKAYDTASPGFEKGAEFFSKGFEQAKKRYEKYSTKDPKAKTPDMEEGQNAISSENIPGTIEKPGVISNFQDKIFGSRNDLDLAGRAVSPRSVKSKGPNQKVEGNNKAYEGLQQLHDDSIAGRIDSDIGTMKGGAEGIEAGLDFWGKKIGEMTNGESKVKIDDIVSNLETHMSDPLSSLSGPVKGIANSILEVFRNEKYKDGMSISDLQQAMSDIKSQIFSDFKLVQALKKETAGRGVGDFINTVSDRFNKAIDETSGNSIELQRAKTAFSRYKQIQGDFMQSLLVNSRNSKIGATGKAGIILGLYELSKGGADAIPKVLALKYITGKMGEYGTRSGAYEKLIRNFDRKALQRSKGVYNSGKTPNSGDRSIFTPKPPKNGNNRGNTSNNNSGVPPQGAFQGGVDSNIPGSKKIIFEVPGNPKGNQSKILAGKKGVMVDPKPEVKLLSPRSSLTMKENATKERIALGEISRQTSLARIKGGTANEKLEAYVDSAIAKGDLSREQAISILNEVKKSVDSGETRFSAEDMKKDRLNTYIEEVKSGKKIDGFEDMIAPKVTIKGDEVTIPKTHKDLYDKLQQIANDGRFGEKTWNETAKEFKKQTGKDIMDTGYDDFDSNGNIKNSAPKTSLTIPKIPEKVKEGKNEKINSNDVNSNDTNNVGELYYKYLKDNKQGSNIIIDSDNVKEMFSNYDPKNPSNVHEISSVLAKKFFEKALRENKSKKVIFTAGGGGSGKSEILIRSIPQNEGAIIFDGTGKNYKKIVGMYDMAKALGKEPEIRAAYIDYGMAKQFNSKRGRNVPEDILADTHKGYRATLLKIVKERPDINVNIQMNTGQKYSNGKPISVRVPKNLIEKFLELRQELE